MNEANIRQLIREILNESWFSRKSVTDDNIDDAEIQSGQYHPKGEVKYSQGMSKEEKHEYDNAPYRWGNRHKWLQSRLPKSEKSEFIIKHLLSYFEENIPAIKRVYAHRGGWNESNEINRQTYEGNFKDLKRNIFECNGCLFWDHGSQTVWTFDVNTLSKLTLPKFISIIENWNSHKRGIVRFSNALISNIGDLYAYKQIKLKPTSDEIENVRGLPISKDTSLRDLSTLILYREFDV